MELTESPVIPPLPQGCPLAGLPAHPQTPRPIPTPPCKVTTVTTQPLCTEMFAGLCKLPLILISLVVVPSQDLIMAC